jgi:hypothetical protein
MAGRWVEKVTMKSAACRFPVLSVTELSWD